MFMDLVVQLIGGSIINMRKKINLDQTISELKTSAASHYGSNGNSHLPVSSDANGFATPEMLAAYSSRFINRTSLPSGTDMLTIKPGYWIVYAPTNNPLPLQPAGSWVVDVTQNDSGDVVLNAEHLYSGSIWTRLIRSSTANTDYMPGMWQQVSTHAILFAGAASGVGTAITLVDAPRKYNSLKIYYTLFGVSGVAEWTSFDPKTGNQVPKNNISFTGFNLTSGDAEWYSALVECNLIMTDITHAKINSLKFMNQSKTGPAANINPSEAQFTIDAVVGYK